MENNEENKNDLQDINLQNTEEQPKEDKRKSEKNEDGDYKIDLSKLNKPEDAIQEQETDASDVAVGQPKNEESSETVVEEIRGTNQNDDESVLEEIKENETAEETAAIENKAEELKDDIAEAIVNNQDKGIELPENIQKVVDFINETNGTLEDYVRLNQDYSKLNEVQLLREYYESTKPHLDKEDIDILMEDFSYDEELDDERYIKKAKIAFKEEVAKAKNYLENLKSKYYEEIKAGSKLTPDQQKAVEFFNRYKKENEETSKIAEKQKQTFLNKTNELFSKDFKGFDYQVGDKKYRFKVNNVNEVKDTQSDINNFIKKFLNENNEISDAAGYHKSLFTAMNPDQVAKHFYEQGKADAIKESMTRTKNISMDARGVHREVPTNAGFTVKAINGNDVSDFKIKIRK